MVLTEILLATDHYYSSIQHEEKDLNTYDHDAILRDNGIYLLESKHARTGPPEDRRDTQYYRLYQVVEENKTLKLIQSTTRSYDPQLDEIFCLFQNNQIYLVRFKEDKTKTIILISEFDNQDEKTLAELEMIFTDIRPNLDHSKIILIGFNHLNRILVLVNYDGVIVKNISKECFITHYWYSPDEKYLYGKGHKNDIVIINIDTLETKYRKEPGTLINVGMSLDSQHLISITDNIHLNIYTNDLTFVKQITLPIHYQKYHWHYNNANYCTIVIEEF